jgi:hypothetical protein
MLETQYRRSRSAAHDAEKAYLRAVARGDDREQLGRLAVAASDSWATVARVCCEGESAARVRIVSPRAATADQGPYLDVRNWRAFAEEAAARSDLLAALMVAHADVPNPGASVTRLSAVAAAAAPLGPV